MSTILYNIYPQEIFNIPLNEIFDGIDINGMIINKIRYADDNVLLADSLDGLQLLLNQVVKVGHEYGITLNTDKIKYMVIARNNNTYARLYAGNVALERADVLLTLDA